MIFLKWFSFFSEINPMKYSKKVDNISYYFIFKKGVCWDIQIFFASWGEKKIKQEAHTTIYELFLPRVGPKSNQVQNLIPVYRRKKNMLMPQGCRSEKFYVISDSILSTKKWYGGEGWSLINIKYLSTKQCVGFIWSQCGRQSIRYFWDNQVNENMN